MGDIRGRRRHGALLAVVALVACALPATASAHAYLVGSDPPAGARLASAPPRVVLRFNEDFVPGSARVTLRKSDGTDVALSPTVARGSTIAQPLPADLQGVFLLTWSLLSDDGHPTTGSIPFSVGASGALPAATASSGPTQWPEAAADWLFFVGLALAIGGILSERLVWRTPSVRAPVIFGIGLALGTAVTSLVLLAADRLHGSFVNGLDVAALRDVSHSRPGALTVGMLALLLVAAALVVARRPLVALAPLAATGVLVALRGHAGTSGDWWAPVADAVHLLAGADGFQPWTSLGGSAVVFQAADCSGDAFVNQLTTPTLTKRYGIILPQGGASPGPWAVSKAWLYVTDPFPSRVDGQPILWKAQWDFTNQCVPYPAPGLTFGGQQWGFWMKKVEDLYVKYKRPFWIP